MAVRVQQLHWFQSFLFNEVGEFLTLMLICAARIDDGAVFLIIPDEVSILLKWVKNEFFQVHDAKIWKG